MTNDNKEISNPFSTGGGGANFENEVHTSFVTLMLAGGFAPSLPPWPITEVKLQGKRLGYDIDDAVIIVERPDGEATAKLLCQIKHSIRITQRNPIFGEIIQAAWNDFTKSGFNAGIDSIALITGPLNRTDIEGVRPLLEWARHKSSVEFFSDGELRKHTSNTKRDKLEVFRHHLKNANNGKVLKNEEVWGFLKSFHLLGYDLDIRSGVTLSLLQSLISQYSIKNAHNLWTQISYEVKSYNQNAGTITCESLPDDICSTFQKPGVMTEPSELGIRTPIPSIDNWDNTKLAIANLLGGWDEKLKNDKQVIEQIAEESYRDWISGVRGTLQQPESLLSFKNKTWTVVKRKEMWRKFGACLFDEYLDRFKKLTIDVLKKLDPKFELSTDKRFAASIYGKELEYSGTLRKGLAESLALLGTQPDALTNCSFNKAEATAIVSVREIFKGADWVLWGSLNNLLPTLAEAAPEEFLNAVEGTLKKDPCPFNELLSQADDGFMGANYMTGLLWGLEALAWDENHLIRVTVILGKLAQLEQAWASGNRPDHSLTNIFLPWLPKTIAKVSKRKSAILALQKYSPDIAWKLLLSLLPSQTQTSSGTYEPRWRMTIPKDWENKVTNKEYFEQVSAYAEIAVETAKGDFDKLAELIGNLDNLTGPSFDKLLAYLQLEQIKDAPEDKRTLLWEVLIRFTANHRKYSETDWALSSELVDRIEAAAESIKPQGSQNLYMRLFSEQDFELYDNNEDYDAEDKKLQKRRNDAVSEIIGTDGLVALINYSEKVESPYKLGFSLGSIQTPLAEPEILPGLLEAENNKLRLFAEGFISGRYYSDGMGWAWVDSIDTSGWTKEQIVKFLVSLRFENETWLRVEKLLGDSEIEYWSKVNVNPWQGKADLDWAIDKLIQYKRPNRAITCIRRLLHNTKEFNKKVAIQALLDAVESKETGHEVSIHDSIDLIKALQEDPETNQQDLLNIEWSYLPVLTGGRDVSPKLLERKLASEPNFFCEAIGLLYKSKNKTEPEKEYTDKQKEVANNFWKLFHDWKTPPGTQTDGSFSEEEFNQWLKDVKTKCEESGHLDMALFTVGNVLIHSTPDQSGLWIHKTIAEALNAEDAERMREGYSIAICNSRGVHCVDPEGKPEKELAAKYRKQAGEVEDLGYINFAGTLKDLVKSYEAQAKRIIEDYKE